MQWFACSFRKWGFTRLRNCVCQCSAFRLVSIVVFFRWIGASAIFVATIANAKVLATFKQCSTMCAALFLSSSVQYAHCCAQVPTVDIKQEIWKICFHVQGGVRRPFWKIEQCFDFACAFSFGECIFVSTPILRRVLSQMEIRLKASRLKAVFNSLYRGSLIFLIWGTCLGQCSEVRLRQNILYHI